MKVYNPHDYIYQRVKSKSDVLARPTFGCCVLKGYFLPWPSVLISCPRVASRLAVLLQASDGLSCLAFLCEAGRSLR